jgi:hypothetical protein
MMASSARFACFNASNSYALRLLSQLTSTWNHYLALQSNG